MSDILIFLIALAAFIYGAACYFIGKSSARYESTRDLQQAYNDGRRFALQDAQAVRKAYDYHFGNRP